MLYQKATEITQILQDAGFEAYFTGGAVRDILMGKEPKDFDITTNARPQEILALFKKAKEITPAQALGVVKVHFKNDDFEVATFRKDIGTVDQRHPLKIEFTQAEEDVKRRDFTVNGLLLDPISNQLIDYVGGLEDLENKILRFIGHPQERIAEDRLRILRAIRFKNQLGFNYDKKTWEAIVKNKNKVLELSPERIRDELTLMLLHPSRVDALKDLDKAGILEKILPEFTQGKGVEQPAKYHEEGDVFTHQLLVMGNLPENPSLELVWAALLHDIGKPLTQTKDKGEIHFYGHDQKGVELVGKIMNQLRFSNRQIETVKWLITNHITVRDLSQRRRANQLKMLSHPYFPDLLHLLRADRSSPLATNFPLIEKLWKDFQKLPKKEKQKSPKDIGLSGKTVIEVLGLDPKKDGPLIGKITNALNEAYLNKEIKTYEEGVRFIQKSVRIKNFPKNEPEDKKTN